MLFRRRSRSQDVDRPHDLMMKMKRVSQILNLVFVEMS